MPLAPCAALPWHRLGAASPPAGTPRISVFGQERPQHPVRGDPSASKGCRQARTAKREEAEGYRCQREGDSRQRRGRVRQCSHHPGKVQHPSRAGYFGTEETPWEPPPQCTSGSPFPTIPHTDWGPPGDAGDLARGSARLPAQPHRQATGSGSRSGKQRRDMWGSSGSTEEAG